MIHKHKLDREHTRVKIQVLAKEKYSLKQISKIADTSISTVQRWKNKKSVKDKKISGRPKKLSPIDK